LRYKLFDKDERGHITFAQTTLYIFELTESEWKAEARKLRSSDDEFIWYKGSRNFVEEININWPKELVYPPVHRMGVSSFQLPNNYLLLSCLNEKNWRSWGLKEEERFSVIRAIEHYNKSYSEGAGVDERDKVLSLSAGFEALLNLPEERIQQSFRSMIITLLGDVSSLGDWALDFYNLRSKIIHGEEISTAPRIRPTNKEKKTASLYFKHSEGEYEYIRHLVIGQNVFRKCLEIILEQRSNRYIHDIVSLLEPNEVHIKRIEDQMKLVKDKMSVNEWYTNGILKEYDELQAKDRTAKPEKVVSLGKSILELLKKYLQDKGVPLDVQIDAILGFKGKYIDLAMAYHAIFEPYEKIYFENSTKKEKIEEFVLENAVYSFISFASHILFFFPGDIT
jgi:hypothetical protein